MIGSCGFLAAWEVERKATRLQLCGVLMFCNVMITTVRCCSGGAQAHSWIVALIRWARMEVCDALAENQARLRSVLGGDACGYRPPPWRRR